VTSEDRFQRTQGVLSPAAIRQLAELHILIAGVGGAGGQAAVDLARMGFGYLTLADFDVYERHNMNRQAGCFESTLGQRKIDVVASMCCDINPELKVRKVPEGITETNSTELLMAGAFPEPAFVLEVIDMAGLQAKIALHRACRERGIIAMTGIMLGLGASLIVFAPDSPPFERLFVRPDGSLNLASAVPKVGSYFIKEFLDACFAGRGHGPTCVIGATTASAMMVTEVLKGLLLGKQAMTTWPEYLYVDLFDQASVRASFGGTR
jgi:molybdopterin/thiamine biosynthesis adenylyltransferase